jgi:hypothetical protein
MQSSVVLALGSRARDDGPKAVGFEQHPENVTKGLVVLDQEDDMHRIGHLDILIDRSRIRPEHTKRAVGCNTRRPEARSNVVAVKVKYLHLLVFAGLGVARRLRASFFGGKRRSHAMALKALVG